MVCHHLAKFGDHRYCTSRDIIFLVFHVIKQYHMIKGSGDYINKSPSRYVTTFPSLVVMGNVLVEI